MKVKLKTKRGARGLMVGMGMATTTRKVIVVKQAESTGGWAAGR